MPSGLSGFGSLPKLNSTGNAAALMPKLGGSSSGGFGSFKTPSMKASNPNAASLMPKLSGSGSFGKSPSMKFPKLSGMGSKMAGAFSNVPKMSSGGGMGMAKMGGTGSFGGMPKFKTGAGMSSNTALRGILSQITRNTVMSPRVTRIPMNRMLRPPGITASW